MAYSSQTTPFATILLRLRDRIVEDLELDESRVVIRKRGGYEVDSLLENFFVIRPLSGLIVADHGAGRISTPVRRVVAIDVFTRHSQDEYGTDLTALSESDYGHYAREEALLDSLLFRFLFSDDVVPVNLLIEPLHPIESIEDPDKPDQERFTGMLVSTQYYDIRYCLRIDSL